MLPEVLHRGVGKALLAGIEEQARRWDISVLRLNSTASARQFYERNGYINAGKEQSCFGVECDFFWKKLDGCSTDSGARFCSCSAQ